MFQWFYHLCDKNNQSIISIHIRPLTAKLRWCLFSSVSHVSDRLELHNNNWASGSKHPGPSESDFYSDVIQEAWSNDLLHTACLLMRLDTPPHDNNARGTKYAVYHASVVRRKSFIRPHEAAAGRRLAPALHSKAGHRICSRSHEECVLTWLACCDRPQDYSFLVTMGAYGVLGLFIDIKALTSKAHFKVDWPIWGIYNNWLLH